MAKIKHVAERKELVIYTDNECFHRYAPDSWYVWMGEALEPLFNCSEMEVAYQEWLNQHGDKESK